MYTSALWAIFWGVYVGLMGLLGQFPAIVVRSSFVKSLYCRWSYGPRFQYVRSALPSMFEQNPGMFEQTCNVLEYTRYGRGRLGYIYICRYNLAHWKGTQLRTKKHAIPCKGWFSTCILKKHEHWVDEEFDKHLNYTQNQTISISKDNDVKKNNMCLPPQRTAHF